MARSRFDRSASYYKRGKPRGGERSGKTLLIVTEGQKSEPHYFKALCERLSLTATNVVITHPDGTDPITLTKKAIELKAERSCKAKTSDVVPYDEVWVVFDMEKIHDERRRLAAKAMAMKEATEAGIRFAFSDSCFEYWLLLHEIYTTAPLNGYEDAVKRLKKFWPDYEKGGQYREVLPVLLRLIEKLPSAVSNAEKCRQHHDGHNGDKNPYTEVDLLVRVMNEATRQHFQFILPS